MNRPRIANNEQIEKIRMLMLRTVADFYSYMNRSIAVNDFDLVAMYAADAAYNLDALAKFLDTPDLTVLRNSLYHQDTAPRDHFSKVFDLIDEAE